MASHKDTGSINGWTVNTLKEHMKVMVDERDKGLIGLLEERDKRYEEKFAAKSELSTITDAAAARAVEALDRSTREFRISAQEKIDDAMPRKEYEVQHKSLQSDLSAHIKNETDRMLAQDDRLDGRLRGIKGDLDKKAEQSEVDTIKQKQDSNNKWLFGMVAALFVSIILTTVDLAMRFLG